MRGRRVKKLLYFVLVLALFCMAVPTGAWAKEIALTPEEELLLAEGRVAYAHAVTLFAQNGDSLLAEQPQYATLPLRAGAVKPNKLEGAVAYLNAIRAAAGLPSLIHSPELSVEAQHKAVLLAYMSLNGIRDESALPPGFDPIFCGKANQTPCAESCHYGNSWASIDSALTEAYSPNSACINRHRLLDPRYTHIGIGQHAELPTGALSDIQAVHKLTGARFSDAEIVAWPPKGVIAAETISPGVAMRWSAQFLRAFEVTERTKVQVDCLNTEQTWSFGEQVNIEGGAFAYAILPSQNMVSFYDRKMVLEPENCYIVTIYNLKNTTTGEIVTYQYRSTAQYLAKTGTNRNDDEPALLRGDANEDGKINSADAAAILRSIVKLETLTPQGSANALVTGGEHLSAADAAKILRWIVRLEAEL